MLGVLRLNLVGWCLLLATACAMPGQGSPSAALQAGASAAAQAPNETLPPVEERSVRFAVLGDTGTGDRRQYEVGRQLWSSHQSFPFEFVIMVGDNLYGSERPQDYVRKFELPYKPILDADIPFYATLGNHDDPNQVFYKRFNMGGERYYTFRKGARGGPSVRFFALDSNYMSREQIRWLEQELDRAGEDWKIAFFHHPLYSSGGRHGSEVDLREQLEPLFQKGGVNAVFAGHEHFYERLKPQGGIYYITAGGSAKLRAGNIRKTAMTAVGFDRDNSYVLVEITRDAMHVQALSRAGRRVDAEMLPRQVAAGTTP